MIERSYRLTDKAITRKTENMVTSDQSNFE